MDNPIETDAFPNVSTEIQPPLSQAERIGNTFFAPSKTFLDVRRNHSWWLPFIIVALFGYLFTLGALTHIGVARIAENTVKASPKAAEKFQQLTPEQQATQMKVTGTIMRYSFLAGPALVLAVTAIMALLLWLGFNFILGGTGTYGGMFAVAVFAMLPGIIKSALAAALVFFGDGESFNISNPVGTNPGFYLPADTDVWLKSLADSLDIFSIWTLALLALGGAIVASVKPKSGFLLVFITWAIVLLIKIGFAAATS